MRLEPLCRLSMRYTEGAWIRPFGTVEGAGFGSGEGEVSGPVLRGTLRWANAPRRREDGVWTPNLRGVITTEDRAEILTSLRGQSVQEATGGLRAILTPGRAPQRRRTLSVAEHDLHRRRGRDRRGDGGVVGAGLRVHQRGRRARSCDRSGSPRGFPSGGPVVAGFGALGRTRTCAPGSGGRCSIR